MKKQKRYLVLGAGGMIGHQMVKRLKKEGNWVRGVDLVYPEFSSTEADEFIIGDLREENICEKVITPDIDVIIQYAAELGGAEYVFTGKNDAEIIHNSALINLNVANVAARKGIKNIAYSSSACFLQGAPVQTQYGVKNIENIQVGDKVLTHNGTYKNVTKVTNNLYAGKIAKAKLRGLPEIKCTEDHRFFNIDGEWKKISDFKSGEVMLTPIPQEMPNKTSFEFSIPKRNLDFMAIKENKVKNLSAFCKVNDIPYQAALRWKRNKTNKLLDPVFNESIKLDEDFGKILGIYLAEGWVEKSAKGRRKVLFAFGEEPELIEETIVLLNKVFGVPRERCRVLKMKNQQGYKIQISSDLLSNFFEENCYTINSKEKRAYSKGISEMLFNTNKEVYSGIVKGFWDGDGCKAEKNQHQRFIFSSVSRQLILGLRKILLNLGIYTSIQVREAKNRLIQGRKVKVKNLYNLYNVSNESLQQINCLFDNLSDLSVRDVYTSFDSSKKAFTTQVEKIELENYLGEVYNLEVEDDHSYTVYGIATHNCIYPKYNQTDPNNPNCEESSAYPAFPDSVYGWEKLFSEIMFDAFARNKGLNISIMRYHNIFSEECDYYSNRAKAPAALCRKVAEAKDGTHIEIFGDGTQTRSFLYIDDCLEGTLRLIESGFDKPLNVGSTEMVTINDLAKMIIDISGKKLEIKHIPGPIGVMGRNSDNKLIKEVLGWEPQSKLRDGIEKLYKWVNQQVNKS